VFDSEGAYVTQGLTGDSAPGEVEFDLDGSLEGVEYQIRLSKARWSFPDGSTRTISVLDPPALVNEFSVVAHEYAYNESINPSLCFVSGYLVSTSGAALPGVTLDFAPRAEFPDFIPSGFYFTGTPSVLDGCPILEGVRVVSDAAGYLEVELPRGGVFDLQIHGQENPSSITEPVVIPDQAGVELADLLFPYISSVVFDPAGPVVLGIGESQEIIVVAVASNGQEIDPSDVPSLLEFESDNADISVSGTGTGFSVTAGAAGSATISVARVATTFAPRLPALPDLATTLEVTAS